MVMCKEQHLLCTRNAQSSIGDMKEKDLMRSRSLSWIAREHVCIIYFIRTTSVHYGILI